MLFHFGCWLVILPQTSDLCPLPKSRGKAALPVWCQQEAELSALQSGVCQSPRSPKRTSPSENTDASLELLDVVQQTRTNLTKYTGLKGPVGCRLCAYLGPELVGWINALPRAQGPGKPALVAAPNPAVKEKHHLPRAASGE